MKRNAAFILIVALIVGVFALLGCDKKSSRPVVVQIGLENHPNEPITQGIYEWKRLIEERSGGSIEVQVFPSSQLGSKNELIDQMLAGLPVITLGSGAFLADRGVPDLGIVFAPYFFETWDEVWQLIESDWWQEQMRLLEEKGLKVLTSNWVYGDRHTLAVRPIRTVADFQGFKLRVPNNIMQIRGTEAIGATPTPMPLGDVYTSLQQRVIDGVENPLSVLVGGRFFEVAKYLSLTAHLRDGTNWFTGTIFFNSLSEEHQRILIETGNEAGIYNNTLQQTADAESLAFLVSEGVEVIDINLNEFIAQSQSFFAMPDVINQWSPGLVETVRRAKQVR